MRLPKLQELSQEQEAVYLNASFDRNILVTGPPGTGKTVIAFFRAQSVAEKETEDRGVQVFMYNKVLGQYTRNAAAGVSVATMHKWVASWWRRLRPMGYSRAPSLAEDSWKHDWMKMCEIIQQAVAGGDVTAAELNYGHLLIDESQDFAPDMFTFFCFLQCSFFKDSPLGPVLSVFADENQRLTDSHNSTIAEIKVAMGISDADCYTLKRNYRNTREIAQLAATFYCGLQTGIPEVPEGTGPDPELFQGASFNDSMIYIYDYIANHDNEEIGIITSTNRVRNRILLALRKKLSDMKTVKLQTYANKDKENIAELMQFDQAGVVSVLNSKSCKGLEFDAVFIPELQDYRFDPANVDEFRMLMYVMISRARRYVCLMQTNSGEGKPEFMQYMPGRDDGLIDYV